jgi:hypothetical protein
MFRVSMLLLFALVLTATGCETGSTHENLADHGLSGQNVGESGTKSGPVPGSATGTDSTSYVNPEKPVEQTSAKTATPAAAPAATPAAK